MSDYFTPTGGVGAKAERSIARLLRGLEDERACRGEVTQDELRIMPASTRPICSKTSPNYEPSS